MFYFSNSKSEDGAWYQRTRRTQVPQLKRREKKGGEERGATLKSSRKSIHVACSEKSTACRKHSMNVSCYYS